MASKTSHLASDPKCRPPSAQPRTQLSMAACPGQRTMKETRGNGYALARDDDDDDDPRRPPAARCYICSSVRRLTASPPSACDVIGSLYAPQFLIHSTLALVFTLEHLQAHWRESDVASRRCSVFGPLSKAPPPIIRHCVGGRGHQQPLQ